MWTLQEKMNRDAGGHSAVDADAEHRTLAGAT